MPRSTKSETAVVSLAAIRSPKRGVTEYLFLERQQIFTLPATGARGGETASLMRSALRQKAPVKVVLDPRRGAILRVDAPTPAELETFKGGKIPTEVR